MNNVKEIDIKYCMCYFLNKMINIKILIKIKRDEKSYKNIIIYYISSTTTNTVKHLYLIINKINEDIEESNGNKYLTLVPTDND